VLRPHRAPMAISIMLKIIGPKLRTHEQGRRRSWSTV
jgi:hypothetical protein